MSSPQIALYRESFKVSDFQTVATGLNYPEGPVWRPDGSVLVVEIGAGNLTRVQPDGTRQVVAHLGGGPNGAAIGPDGAVYVCNDGGFTIVPMEGVQVCLGPSADYQGGCIQRVAGDGTFKTLYSSFSATNPATGKPETLPLRSPDDLVFDRHGGFWMTDWGKDRWRDGDLTGVYYAQPDGSSIEEMIFPLRSPNGLALSPDESRLYVAESWTRRILYWNLSGPGKIDRTGTKTLDGSHLLTASIPFQAGLDSMSIDEEGNLYAVSILPNGPDPTARGGITVVSPKGEILEWIEIDIGAADPLPSNISFGGPDRKTAFITLGGTGRLISCQMRVAGKKPAFE